MFFTKDTINPILERIKTSPKLRWYILANVVLGNFMAALDSSIVNVALPTMSKTFQVDLSTIQWVVTAYLLTICSLLPVFGRLADMIGRKKIYSTGFIFFAVGSALCGLSSNIWFLVGMRVLQAIGASMLMSNNQAIVVSNFPVNERGRALGISGTAVALGALSGPALGGLLVSLAGWRSIFYVTVPISIIAFVAAQMILPSDSEKKKVPFDYKGSILFTLGLLALLFGVNNGHNLGWTSLGILGPMVVGFCLLGAFFHTESKLKNPLIDFSIYRNRPFMIGNLSSFLNFIANYAHIMLMPFYLQNILHYPIAKVGLLMAIFPVCMAITAPFSGYASDRIGPVWLTTGGLFLKGCGFIYTALFTNTATTFWQIAPSFIMLGVGTGLFQSPNNSSVLSAVRKDQVGVAGGLNALVRNIGNILGASFSVLLLENRQAAYLSGIVHPTAEQTASTFVSAFHVVMLVAAGITLIAACISLSRKGYIANVKSKAV